MFIYIFTLQFILSVEIRYNYLVQLQQQYFYKIYLQRILALNRNNLLSVCQLLTQVGFQQETSVLLYHQPTSNLPTKAQQWCNHQLLRRILIRQVRSKLQKSLYLAYIKNLCYLDMYTIWSYQYEAVLSLPKISSLIQGNEIRNSIQRHLCCYRRKLYVKS